jgi:putative FmdB family regulatory protein
MAAALTTKTFSRPQIDAKQSSTLQSKTNLKVVPRNFSHPMPLYEYQCKKCGHRFEKIQKFSDKPIRKCPECGGAVEQIISAPAVQNKGSAWYVTDYAKKSHTSASDSGSKESKENKKDEKKAESTSKDATVKKAEKGK